uniref:serotriflin-like n=1 Tax=Euleptes europaea TaxID=460621 RepID=UPI00253FD2A9|nr:serotriflin-like [Euleptes europaea]
MWVLAGFSFRNFYHNNGCTYEESEEESEEEEGKKEDKEDWEEDDEGSGILPKMQKIIVNKHNKIRRNVKPTAANMLQMDNFKYGVGTTDPKQNIFGYTQIIWYNSYLIGCAVAYCPEITFPYVYICHYCPGGNLKKQVARPYKEGPPCRDCPNKCKDKLCTNPCKYRDKLWNCKDLLKIYTYSG